MNPVTDKLRSDHKPIGQRLAQWLMKLPQAFLAASAAALPFPALAQADQILKDARNNLATVMEVGMWILLAGGYLGAAYMIITGAIRLFQDREGGLARFGLGVLVAIIMVVLMTFFVTAGQTEIDKIKSP